MDLEKIVQLVSSRIGPLAADHKRCSKLRSPMSNCDKCQQVCPVDALSFDQDGIDFNDKCFQCGLCAAVCPTQALAIQEPTELNLLEKVKKIGANGGTVVIGCKQEPVKGAENMSVSCIGALTPEFLISLGTASYPVYVVLDPPTCNKCEMAMGYELFKESHSKAQKLREKLNLVGNGITVTDNPPEIKQPVLKKDQVDMGRRNFFSSIFGGLKKAPQVAVDNLADSFIEEKVEEHKIKKMPEITTDRLKILQSILPINDGSEVSVDSFLRPRASENTCYFCRACAIMCPVGALECNEETKEVKLKSRHCTGCGLCTDICFHKSLKLALPLVGEMRDEKPLVLFAGESLQCDSCGVELITSDNVDKCPVCRQKEQENFESDLKEE